MPRGTTRDRDSRIVQLIDPHHVERVTFDDGEWCVSAVTLLHTVPKSHRFAGNVAVYFRIHEVVSRIMRPIPWDGPVGVVLHTDRFSFELIPCSRIEYERIPTKHACAVG